ncbi:MAG: NAD(+)/NADH kinase [Verrucomicrobia bacterium]|nr:NAD(+)/NADH kinase [Verrucomicrobiota bacterium]
MKRLGIIANVTKARATDVLRRIATTSKALGLELCADAATAALAPELGGVADRDGFTGIDAMMALGGDGTMLRAFRSLNGNDVPLIGVNIGSLGFLTSVAEGDLERALTCLAHDEIVFSRRSVAACVAEQGKKEVGRYAGLNDVVIGGGSATRVITLRVSVGGDPVASYLCDGLIISTPTGSTGHNLSAGGPIMVPETRAFVITPICPHTLSSRPLVVPDDSDIEIQVATAPEAGLNLTVDGQVGHALRANDIVRVHASRTGVRFIHLPGYSYFSVLSQKLGWKGSNVR